MNQIQTTKSADQDILQRIKASEPSLGECALLNGARLIFASVDSYPKVSIAIHFDAGSRRETPELQGASHFFEHLPPASFRLLNGGESLGQYVAARGWDVNIYINQEQLTFGFGCPDFDAEEAMMMLKKILTADEDLYRQVFPIEKGRILNEIKQGRMRRGEASYQFLNRLLFDGTGYAHPPDGSLEKVSSYSFEDVMTLGRDIMSPLKATVAISGPQRIINSAISFFEGMSFRSDSAAHPPFEFGGKPDWDKVPKLSRHNCPLFNAVDISVLLPGAKGYDYRKNLALGMVLDELSLQMRKALSHEAGLSYGGGVRQSQFSQARVIKAQANVEPVHVSQALEIINGAMRELPSQITQKVIDNAYLSSRNLAYLAINFRDYGGLLAAMAEAPERPHVSTSESLEIMRDLRVEELRTLAAEYIDPEKTRIILQGAQAALDKIQ